MDTDLSYNAVKQRALTALQSTGGSSTTSTPSSGNKSLDQLSTTLAANNSGESSIMDSYQNRVNNARSLLPAQTAQINAQYNPAIENQKLTNDVEMSSARQGINGPAVNTAVMRDMENTAAKRIRDLTATRDQLLMSANIQSATQIDNLISQEQTAVTTARQNYYSNLLGLGNAQNTASLVPSQIAGNQASAAAALSSANLNNVNASQGKMLIDLLGGNSSGTTSGGGTTDNSGGNGAINLDSDAADLATGKLAAQTLKDRYTALGPLGVMMYQKILSLARQKNPNFSETQSNLNYQGAQQRTSNLNSGIPGVGAYQALVNSFSSPSTNQGSLFNFLNPSKVMSSGKTSSGVGYKIIDTK